MNAKFVNEYLNFERKGSPLERMDIGQKVIDQRIIDETDWQLNIKDPLFNNLEVIKLIRDYKGYPILIVKAKWKNISKPYIATSIGIQTDPDKDPKWVEERAKHIIDWHLDVKKIEGRKNRIKESLEFNREGDSLQKMGIGQSSNEEFINETDWQMPYLEQAEIVDLIRDYKGYPILVVKLEGDLGYQATSTFDYSNACNSIKKAELAMKKRIDTYIRKTSRA
jgi:hypothetical protein